MKKFILASKNSHKAAEIKKILGDGVEIITQTEAGIDTDIEEDGETFEENAVKKAEGIMRVAKMPTIADDSGLCVDFLGGAPGVHSARYAGEHGNDEKNKEKLLEELSGVEDEKRTARFVCTVAIAYPDKETVVFRGECEGKIAFSESGENGFGYDPLFFVPEYNCTMAELPAETKNSISHRYNALKKVKQYLDKF